MNSASAGSTHKANAMVIGKFQVERMNIDGCWDAILALVDDGCDAFSALKSRLPRFRVGNVQSNPGQSGASEVEAGIGRAKRREILREGAAGDIGGCLYRGSPKSAVSFLRSILD